MRLNCLYERIVYLSLLITLVIIGITSTTQAETFNACQAPWAIVCFDNNNTCRNCESNNDCELAGSNIWTFARFRDTSGCGSLRFVDFDTDPYLLYATMSWEYKSSSHNWQGADVWIWKDDRPTYNPKEECIHPSTWNSLNCPTYVAHNSGGISNANKVSLSTNADQWGQCGSAGSTACGSPDIKLDIGQQAEWEDDNDIVILFSDASSSSGNFIKSNNQSDAFTLNVLRDLPPTFEECKDSSTDEDSDGTNISIDLWPCHTDPDDADADNTFTIFSQSNQQLIDCYIVNNSNNPQSNQYLNCTAPVTDQNGFNEIEIQVDDGYFTNLTNLTITVNSINDPPNFTVNTTSSSNNTEQGTSILFKAQIDDNDEVDDVKFFVCDAFGRSGTGCAYQMLCSYNSTKDGWKSCSYDTSSLTSSMFLATSYACDSSGGCTSDAAELHTVIRRPSEVKMHIGSHLQVYNGTGFFIGPERVVNFSDILEEELTTCVADEQGYCNITLKFTSNTAGKLNLSDLRIYTQQTIRVENLTVLQTSGLSVIVGYKIINELPFDSYTQWGLDFGDGSIINNTLEIPLNSTENSFVIVEHTYTSSGTYRVTAMAFNETYISNRTIDVMV